MTSFADSWKLKTDATFEFWSNQNEISVKIEKGVSERERVKERQKHKIHYLMHAANAINYCCSQLEFVIDVAFLCIEICWKCLNNKQNRWFIHFIEIFCIMCSFSHSPIESNFCKSFMIVNDRRIFPLHALTQVTLLM